MKKIKEKDNKKEIEEESDEAILKMIKDMKRGLETLKEYGLIEQNPKSRKCRLTDKCHEEIENFLDFINITGWINEQYHEKDLETTDGEWLEFAKEFLAMHVLDKFGLCQFKKKINAREWRLVKCLSIFININMIGVGQNWKQSNGN